jgi:hypothetical protein
MVLFGLIRGVRTMMRTPPPPRPVIAQNQAATPAPGATQAPAPNATQARPGMMRNMGPGQRRMMMMRRFAPRVRGPLGTGFFLLPRNPQLAGLAIILFALLRGMIILMVVRILAEMGLAVLAMPRRSEI